MQHADVSSAYINDEATEHLTTGDPVISVDTKKKELVGEYKNGGRDWRPAGEPEKVKVHDFIDRDRNSAGTLLMGRTRTISLLTTRR